MCNQTQPAPADEQILILQHNNAGNADTVQSPVSPISPTTPNDTDPSGPSLASIASTDNHIFKDTRASASGIIDPMQEDAVFNMPLDSTSLQAHESPVLNTNHSNNHEPPIPIRLPELSPNSTNHSDGSASSAANAPEAPPTGEATAAQSRRQPRKLTKNRGGSDANLDQETRAAERDKHKGVLTKKPPHVADGDKNDMAA
jgi:hypothetical protein